MVKVIKGFSEGSSPTVGGISVSGYATPPAGATDLLTIRHNVVTLDGVTDFEITSVPAGIKAYKRRDGLLGVDMTEYLEPAGELVIGYNDLTSGSVPKTFTFLPQQGLERFGWGDGRHYMLEKDANDTVIVERLPVNARKMHISTSGLSKEAVATREGIGNATAAFLLNAVAKPGPDIPEANGALRYGEIPELALDETAAKLSFQQWGTAYGAGSYEILLKRGETFNIWSGAGASEMRGYSPLHPIRVGVYGDVADGPASVRSIPAYDCCVVQGEGDITLTNLNSEESIKFMILEGVTGLQQWGFRYNIRGTSEYITVRHHQAYECVPRSPDPAKNDPTIWDVHAAHECAHYFAGVAGILLESSYMDQIGWSLGYDFDGDINEPFPANQFSHGDYFAGGQADITIRNRGIFRPSLTTGQYRSGAIMYDCFVGGSNHHAFFAPGPEGDDNQGYTGPWSYVLDCVHTWAGQKREDIDFMNTSLGFRIKSHTFSVRNSCLMNSGAAPVFAVDGAWPRAAADNAYNDADGSTFVNDLLIYEWMSPFNSNSNIGGLDTAVLDGTTIEAYNDHWQSTTGSHRNDLLANLRAEDKPWEQVSDMHAWWMARLNKSKPTRTDPETMIFEPYATGETPGIRWDIRLDWKTADNIGNGTMPGSVAGDSVDLNGYRVISFDSPENSLADFDVNGGDFTHRGGRINLTGNITDTATGGSITQEGASQIWMAGGTVAAGITHDIIRAGRFANTGALSYAGDMTVGGRSQLLMGVAGGAFTLASGGSLTLSGEARTGFDGDSGTPSLTLATGSTVNMMPECQVRVSRDNSTYSVFGEHQIGDTVTGATSSFAGVITYIDTFSDLEQYLHIRVTSGTPQSGELIRGKRWFGQPNGGLNGKLFTATVSHILTAPVWLMPKIETVQSGVYDLASPSVTTTITVGGTLTVDESNLSSGSYVLMEADTITGSFTSKPANVTVGATQVVLNVA